MQQAINWFEIPSHNFDRAVRFYEQVFAVSLRREEMGCGKMGVFPYAAPATGGAVINAELYKPNADGVVIYLSGGEDLAGPLARVSAAGGKVVTPKTLIAPEIGYFALFTDSEGNRVGLHSPH